MTDTRLIAYTPNGASLGPLPTPSDVSASFVLNDVGALTFSYALDAPRSSLLGTPIEVAVQVTTDLGQTWVEPQGGRFVYYRDGRDPVKGDQFAIECPGYLTRLAKALVPFTGLDGNGQRTFSAKTPGFVLATLFTEAQARGAMTGMAWDFSATVDSSGAAWPTTVTLSYEPGHDFLAILQDLADQGYIDYASTGRTVQAYTATSSTGLALDKTVGASPVSLRYGRDLTEAPFRRTWEGLADTAFIQGDNNANLTRTNAGAVTPWGRQETYVSAGGVTDAGTLQVLGDAALSLTADQRTEWTYGLVFASTPYLPFRDYFLGSYVFAVTDGSVVPVRMRVRQITLSDGDDTYSGNVVLNDRFLEQDVRTARDIAKITGGATISGTGTTPGVGNDILAPAAPGALTYSSSAYLDLETQRAQVTVDWADVSTNLDGTPLSDLAGYRVWSQPAGGVWAMKAQVDASLFTDSPYVPGSSWNFKVQTVDTSGNTSPFSPVLAVTMGTDTTPPVAPSTPTVSSSGGVLKVNWDGLNNVGAAMDLDVRAVEVHLYTASGTNPNPAAATRVATLIKAGQVQVRDLVIGSQWYAKLVAIDVAGNYSRSAQSAQVTVSPVTDGAAPTGTPGSPTLVPLGIAALSAQWVAVTNNDPVTYEVFLGTTSGFTPGSTNKVGEVAGTGLSIARLTSGATLAPGTTYYMRVRAKDGDGTGPLTAVVSGTPKAAGNAEISASYAYVGTLSANQIQAGLVGADIVVSGRFLTATSGQRVEITGAGIAWYSATDTTTPSTILPTDSSQRARLGNADIDVNAATVSDGLSMRKPLTVSDSARLEPGATLRLALGLQPPQNAPTVQVSWDTVPLNGLAPPSTGDGGAYTLGVHKDASYAFQCVRAGSLDATYGWSPQVARWPSAGGAAPTAVYNPDSVNLHPSDGSTIVDICAATGAGNYYGLWVSADRRSWEINAYSAAMALGANFFTTISNATYQSTYTPLTQTFIPTGIWWDGTYMWVVGSLIPKGSASTGPNNGQGLVNLLRITAAGVITRYTCGLNVNGNYQAYLDGPPTVYYNGDLRYGLYVGAADFGASSVVFGSNASGSGVQCVYQISGSTMSEATDLTFPTANNKNTQGLAYDGSVFWTQTLFDISAGVGSLNKHTAITWTSANANVWWISYQWRQASGGYSTPTGPKASLVMQKRGRVTAKASSYPSSGTPANDPDQVAFFLGRGTTEPATSAMFLQGAAQSLPTDNLSTATFSGTAASSFAANTFPTQGSGGVASQDGLTFMQGDGSADFPLMRAQALVAVQATAQTGSQVRLGIVNTHYNAQTTDAANSGVKVTRAGVYAISGTLRMNPFTAGAYLLETRQNSGGVVGSGSALSDYYFTSTGPSGNNSLILPAQFVVLAAGDEVHFFMTAPSAATIVAGLASRFTVARIA